MGLFPFIREVYSATDERLFRSILASVDLKEEVSISVQATSSSINMLLELLSSGFVIGSTREEVDEVKEAAEALGLDLGDCQV